jgi:hypothetical protein
MSKIIFEGKLVGETVAEIFDFTSRLSPTETISTAIVTASVYSGTDASPSAIISGSTTISEQKVTQRITAGVLGVTYKLLCTITTSRTQTLQLSGFLVIITDLE